MQLTEMFLAELEREAASTRRALERVPEGRNDWKPHQKSMPLGYLATLVATIFGWIDFMVNEDQLDMTPKGDSKYKQKDLTTKSELLAALDESVAKARKALENTTDEHLMKTWRFVVGGHRSQRESATHHDPRRRVQPPRASSRTADCLPAAQ